MWVAFGLAGGLLAILACAELVIFSVAPWPAMSETEAEYGFPSPNKGLIMLLMVVRPLLSVAVGLGATLASLSTSGMLDRT